MTVFPVHIANLDVQSASLSNADRHWECGLEISANSGQESVRSQGGDEESAVLNLVRQMCISSQQGQLRLAIKVSRSAEEVCGKTAACVALFNGEASFAANDPIGVGRYQCEQRGQAIVLAAVRAASHGGILKASYRANNQKAFRDWANLLAEDLSELAEQSQLPETWKSKEREAVILEHFNRVASAAVITATNHPTQDKLLQLYDASAWLYDTAGHKRDSFTDTQSWLAWYPGLLSGGRTVQEVVDSMPNAPDTAIPWIVRVFENPKSWLQLRGSQTLADHDCLHVLLGRGLQDQDEAFVIGFAMGTAKQVPYWQRALLPFAMSRLYPEPYRVPRSLLPAFRLGVECGTETGIKNLYRESLTSLAHLDIDDARSRLKIDTGVLRKYYAKERIEIPGTVATVRL